MKDSSLFKVWKTFTFPTHGYIIYKMKRKVILAEHQDKWLLLPASTEGSRSHIAQTPGGRPCGKRTLSLVKGNKRPQSTGYSISHTPKHTVNYLNSFNHRSWHDFQFFSFYEKILRNILTFTNPRRQFSFGRLWAHRLVAELVVKNKMKEEGKNYILIHFIWFSKIPSN